MQHEQQRKLCIQYFIYCSVCILCHGNVLTVGLHSNNRGIHIGMELMGEIYEARH
jgi:hypothetical protein